MGFPIRARRFAWPFFALCLLLSLSGPGQPRGQGLIQELSATVEREFYDPRLGGVDWRAASQKAAQELAQAQDWSSRSLIANRLLERLHASHTHYYSPEDQGYYEILGVFAPLAGGDLRRWLDQAFPQGVPAYDGLGLFVEEHPQGLFVSAVWDGFPAAQAGVKVGDRVVAADGVPFRPVPSCRGKSQVELKLESSPGQLRSLKVHVQHLDTTTCFREAMKKSLRLEHRGGHTLTYVHVWSYAGEPMHQALVDLLSEEGSGGEGLVLDLRDGWGGAFPNCLNLFNTKVPPMEMIGRDGRVSSYDTQWRKPVVMLINQGSRSGKEILAYGFRRYHLGTLVGTPTAGYVLGGRPYPLEAGGVLYLAVADVRVDGRRLEGVGVEPDVRVERPIPYCQGADPQLEKAFQVLLEQLK